MNELLRDLAESKLVKVTGSYALGKQQDDSDIDFYVKEDDPEWYLKGKKRNIEVIIEILNKHHIKWRSTTPGYIFTHNTTGNGYLEKQLEFSDLFKKKKGKLPYVEIFGVRFHTY